MFSLLTEINSLVESFPGKFVALKKSLGHRLMIISYFSWQIWETRLFWGLGLLLVDPFKSTVHSALIAWYLDSETHYVNGCLFSCLISLSMIFPEAGFIIILKIPSVFLKASPLSFGQIYIWFLSYGSTELLQVQRVATVQFLSKVILFHKIAGQQLGQFITVNLGLLLQRWSISFGLSSMTLA